MRVMTGIGLVAGLACFGGSAAATTAPTVTFGVSLTIQAQCLISNAQPLAFGTSGLLNTTSANDVSTTFQVQCSNTTPFTIGLDAGTGTGATTTTRLMTSAASATIAYTLWQDTGHSTNWGNSGSGLLGDNGTGSAVTYTVYGRVPAQATPAPGLYSDTITITVTY
jgi:spore coat protein U-like protein